MAATGTGLEGQLGIKSEVTPGTAVVVDKFFEFNNESMDYKPTYLEPTGLRVGREMKRDARVVLSRFTVDGAVELEHATKLMGLWWKLALNSGVTSPTLITGTAYKQVHQQTAGNPPSFTMQAGRPQPSGVVTPFTWNGCKVAGWEFSVSDGQTAVLHLDIDAWNETTATALATATFLAGAGVFNFQQASTFKTGGTPTTTTSIVSIATGVAVPTVVKKFSLKGVIPLADDRQGLGNSGQKKEQLKNGTPLITGTLDAEFDKATWYDVFKANASIAIQLSMVGAQIAATGSFDTLDFVIAKARIKGNPVHVDGPDIVNGSVAFEVYDDEVNITPLQVTLISTDSSAL